MVGCIYFWGSNTYFPMLNLCKTHQSCLLYFTKFFIYFLEINKHTYFINNISFFIYFTDFSLNLQNVYGNLNINVKSIEILLLQLKKKDFKSLR